MKHPYLSRAVLTERPTFRIFRLPRCELLGPFFKNAGSFWMIKTLQTIRCNIYLAYYQRYFYCQLGWSYITYSPSSLGSKPAQNPMDDRKAPFRWFRHTSRPRCMRPTNRGNTTRCRWKYLWKRWRPGMMPRPEVRAWQLVFFFFCWCLREVSGAPEVVR